MTEFDESPPPGSGATCGAGLAFATGLCAHHRPCCRVFPLFTAPNVRGTIRATLAIVLTIPLVPLIEPQLMQMGIPDRG